MPGPFPQRAMSRRADHTAACKYRIVSVLLPGETMDPGKLTEALLTKYNMLVTPISAPSLNGIRGSPKVYTSTAEIDMFCDAVEAIVPRA
jgi:hypothetical protein